ncbi:MAG: phosphate signaling complex protein PhoU [Bacteriovorax sp.]|jgi:phosphate transport system protein|nr:phosphate signaling complex protein PhoU [Bacteriovorax sp.]
MDISPKDLRDHVLKMASLVEASLSGALNLDKSMEDIFELERKINEFHMLIDDACFKYIALKGPAAKDLRTAIAVMKINADLERMGDQALKIKRQYMSIGKEILPLKNMALEVNIMVKNALDSFVRSNIKLATDVIEYDQEINLLNLYIVRNHVNMIKNNEMAFDEGYTIIKISKNLERIGDHAKNIAEDVIFLESGSDIRHNPEFKTGKKD